MITQMVRNMSFTKNSPALITGVFLVTLLSLENRATAASITTNTAMPVAVGEFIWRELLVLMRSGKDPSGQARDMSVDSLVSVLGHGITPKLALFGVLPYSRKSLQQNPPGSPIERSNNGLSDPTLFGRYTFFQDDGTGQTLRAAGLAGLKVPLSNNSKQDSLGELPVPLQQSTGAWDGFVGVVATYQTLDFQLDGQVQYRRNGSSNGINFGDEVHLDTSFQYRLWPRELSGGVPGFVYGVIEANWVHKDNNIGPGGQDVNTGGRTLFLSPGFQYVTKRYILEAAVQIPVYQDLNGTGLKNGYILRTGFRFNF